MNPQPPADQATAARLAPRPLWRPAVDPNQAAAYGRPSGPAGRGPFTDRPAELRAPSTPAPPITPMLDDAFGRPPGPGPSLGRPASKAPAPLPPDKPEPWRDPQSAMQLGAPALDAAVSRPSEPSQAGRFTLRQALFEHRLRPSALIGMLVLCLVIGAGGAALGVLGANRIPARATDADVSVASAAPAVDRPAGSVAAIAARVLPSVVEIEVTSGTTGDTGSGVVIDKNGYILTNNHVISSAATDTSAALTVMFDDGRNAQVPATIVGRDLETDLAVIKVDVTGATVATLGDSDKLAVGDPVIAIGSPLGLAGTVTTGIVSAKNRPVRLQSSDSDTNAVIDALQTDAAINPGNSGGPLVDGTGAVVGINSAIRTLGSDDTGSIGLGFAIPINTARQIAQELINTGKVVHPTIGVNASSATNGTTAGALVQNVVTGGPAAKAGIQEGDVIVKVGSRVVGDADELVVAVQAHAVGDTVPVQLTRAGRTMTVQVTLTAEKSAG